MKESHTSSLVENIHLNIFVEEFERKLGVKIIFTSNISIVERNGIKIKHVGFEIKPGCVTLFEGEFIGDKSHWIVNMTSPVDNPGFLSFLEEKE